MAARSALYTVMERAVRKAGRALTRDFGEVEHLQSALKGPGDFVSVADKRAEATLRAGAVVLAGIGLVRRPSVRRPAGR